MRSVLWEVPWSSGLPMHSPSASWQEKLRLHAEQVSALEVTLGSTKHNFFFWGGGGNRGEGLSDEADWATFAKQYDGHKKEKNAAKLKVSIETVEKDCRVVRKAETTTVGPAFKKKTCLALGEGKWGLKIT